MLLPRRPVSLKIGSQIQIQIQIPYYLPPRAPCLPLLSTGIRCPHPSTLSAWPYITRLLGPYPSKGRCPGSQHVDRGWAGRQTTGEGGARGADQVLDVRVGVRKEVVHKDVEVVRQPCHIQKPARSS